MFSRYTSWYADSYEINFEMPFHVTFRVRSLEKRSLFGAKTCISIENMWFLCHIHFKAYSFRKIQFNLTFPNIFAIFEAKHLHDMMKFSSLPLHIFTFRIKTLYILTKHGNPSKFPDFLHSDTLQHALSNESKFRVCPQVTFWVSTDSKQFDLMAEYWK